jgi:hypothetical protein
MNNAEASMHVKCYPAFPHHGAMEDRCSAAFTIRPEAVEEWIQFPFRCHSHVVMKVTWDDNDKGTSTVII